ncbi:hypothetical protein [Rhizobium sp. RU36D]|uniref:hypothetical protein n=1 Tax=Rhizobium sp. RU36D TaxID=1907415 RepID=UPI0009D79D1A|nr:hypothetical protein [Rhizobium sp. RU36D]SMD15143.1 hypothetical protein SAMN05880593_12735 [Rhizobium sp. RU36D]
MVPDIERYRRHIEAFDLSEDQKTEILVAVWNLVEGFVDRAFDHDSYALAASGPPEIGDHTATLIDFKEPSMSGAFNATNRGETKTL